MHPLSVPKYAPRERMICNETDGGWDIIFQRAHALLAADLLAPLRRDLRPDPWPRIVHAAAQHDHGWQEWEPGGRLAEDGTPQHFTGARLEDIAVQSRPLLRRTWHQNRWVALLIAHHIHHLYGRRRGQDDALDAFLDEQEGWRRAWRDELGVSPDEEDRAYAPLRWADALSLALCCRQLEDGEADIGPGPAGREDSTAVLLSAGAEGAAVTVRPWPYGIERFTVTIDTYRLRQRTFNGHDALIEALSETKATQRSWTIQAP